MCNGVMNKPTIRSLIARDKINQLVVLWSLDFVAINQITNPFPAIAVILTDKLLYKYHDILDRCFPVMSLTHFTIVMCDGQ